MTPSVPIQYLNPDSPIIFIFILESESSFAPRFLRLSVTPLSNSFLDLYVKVELLGTKVLLAVDVAIRLLLVPIFVFAKISRS